MDNQRGNPSSSTDRLSNLPDPVIHHILSFVSTKTVVQTSVLSRKWVCVWKDVPALEFNFSDFASGIGSIENPYNFGRFNKFVEMVLSLHNDTGFERIIYARPLKRSARDMLSDPDSEGEQDQPEAEDVPDDLVLRVFQYAVSHKARQLVLRQNDWSTCAPYSNKFPQGLGPFPDSKLEHLHLVSCVIDDRFKSFGFPLLTTLELFHCMFASYHKVLDPFSTLPCLNSLTIVNPEHNEQLETLKISGVGLHSMKLVNTDFIFDICAPNLKYFTLVEGKLKDRMESRIPQQFSAQTFPSLDHAHITVSRFGDIGKENMVLVLQGFHNIKSLTLSRDIIEVLCEDIEFVERQPSPFTRLENLNVVKVPELPSELVDYFFQRSSCASPKVKTFL